MQGNRTTAGRLPAEADLNYNHFFGDATHEAREGVLRCLKYFISSYPISDLGSWTEVEAVTCLKTNEAEQRELASESVPPATTL